MDAQLVQAVSVRLVQRVSQLDANAELVVLLTAVAATDGHDRVVHEAISLGGVRLLEDDALDGHVVADVLLDGGRNLTTAVAQDAGANLELLAGSRVFLAADLKDVAGVGRLLQGAVSGVFLDVREDADAHGRAAAAQPAHDVVSGLPVLAHVGCAVVEQELTLGGDELDTVVGTLLSRERREQQGQTLCRHEDLAVVDDPRAYGRVKKFSHRALLEV